MFISTFFLVINLKFAMAYVFLVTRYFMKTLQAVHSFSFITYCMLENKVTVKLCGIWNILVLQSDLGFSGFVMHVVNVMYQILFWAEHFCRI